MKRRSVILLVVVCLGGLAWFFLRRESPAIPFSSETVLISLREPYEGKVIVEKTVSDPSVIEAMAKAFSRARSGSDHKCASIGTIAFISQTETTTLKVLPGHNTDRYEFRLDGELYFLPRRSYIECLVAAGIDRDDIRLDGHPDIEQIEADQHATAVGSKAEANGKAKPESEGGSQ